MSSQTAYPLRPGAAVIGVAQVIVLTAILAACTGSGAGAPSASTPPASPAPSVAAPTDPTDGGAVDLTFEDMAGDLTAIDGKTVSTSAYLLITDDVAQLCGVLLESYPPQCGAVTLRVLGEVPAEALAAMQTTQGDDVTKAWWSRVDVTGVVDATGSVGTPTFTLTGITVSDGY